MLRGAKGQSEVPPTTASGGGHQQQCGVKWGGGAHGPAPKAVGANWTQNDGGRGNEPRPKAADREGREQIRTRCSAGKPDPDLRWQGRGQASQASVSTCPPHLV